MKFFIESEMKRLIWMIISALICGIAFTSCGSDSSGPPKSFNLTTRELIVSEDALNYIMENRGNIMTITCNKVPFFNFFRIIYPNPILSFCELVLFVDQDNKIYLNDGYLPENSDLWTEEQREEIERQKVKNAELIKEEWANFIKYLTDNDKIVK